MDNLTKMKKEKLAQMRNVSAFCICALTFLPARL